MLVRYDGVLTAVFVLLVGAEFKGAPTAISQRCPGSPCLGFRPFAAVGVVVLAVVGFVVLVALAGVEFSGAPTAISHLWPGCP